MYIHVFHYFLPFLCLGFAEIAIIIIDGVDKSNLFLLSILHFTMCIPTQSTLKNRLSAYNPTDDDYDEYGRSLDDDELVSPSTAGEMLVVCKTQCDVGSSLA